MNYKKIINKYSLINLLTIIFLLALPYYLFSGKLYLGGDDTKLFYSYPFEYLKNIAFFSWVNISSIGINASSQSLIPFLLIVMFIKFFISNVVVLNYLAFSVPLVLGFIYFNKAVRELFSLKEAFKFETYLGSLFFILSPIIVYDQMFIFLTTIWLLGLIPAILYYFIRYLKYSNFIDVYKSLILSIIFSFVIFSVPWILGLVLPLSIGLLITLKFYKKRHILQVFKKSIIFFGIIILAQAFWLIGFISPYLMQDKNSYAQKFLSKGFLDTFTPTVLSTATGTIIYPLLNLFHRQIAFDFEWKLKDAFVSFYDKTFALNLLFVLILAFGFLNYKKYLDKLSRRIFLSLFVAFIFSLYFFTVNIGPLKNLFLFLGNVPGFVMFRNFYDKFAIGYILLYSTLATISLIMLSKRFLKNRNIIMLILFTVVLLNFIPVKLIVDSPLWSTRNIYKNTIIPDEYLNFMNKIGSTVSPSDTILSVPFGESVYTAIKDATSNNTYVGISPVKIFSGINDISGAMSFNFTNETYLIDQIIIDRKYNELNKILFNHNINYVMVTKNIPSEVLKSYAYSALVLPKQDSTFLSAITDKKLMVSDKGNYELYTAKRQNSLLSSDNLYFQKINAVEYRLYIRNISRLQILKFNDSFHPDWRLYPVKNANMNFCKTEKFNKYSNTTECKDNFKFFNPSDLFYAWNRSIFDSSHFSTDAYTNEWNIDPKLIKTTLNKDFYTINKDGTINIELVLYFKPQVYFYYGVIISLFVFLTASGYLVFSIGRRKKHGTN